MVRTSVVFLVGNSPCCRACLENRTSGACSGTDALWIQCCCSCVKSDGQRQSGSPSSLRGGSPLPASSSYSTNGSRGESRGFGTLGVVPFHVRIVGSASLGSDVTAVAESFRAVASNRPMMKIIVHEGIGSGNHTSYGFSTPRTHISRIGSRS